MLFLDELEQSVLRLKGIGPRSQKDFSNLGIYTIGQLLRHYPLRYENRINIIPLAQWTQERPVNTTVTVLRQEWIGGGRKRSLKVWVEDETERAALLCFGREFLQTLLVPGKTFRLFGQMNHKYGELQCSSFEVEDPDHPRGLFDCILPVYSLSGNLQQKTVRKAVRQSINEWLLHIEDELPEDLRQHYRFPAMSEAVRMIHLPESTDEIFRAREFLVYQEWFHFYITIGKRIQGIRKKRNKGLNVSIENLEPILKTLPFQLTEDQNTVMNEIVKDLKSPYPMNRLLQGEVGSGKTLIAFFSSLLVKNSGGQTAFMAPTELLAKQHYQNSLKFFPKGASCLLTGVTDKKQREQIEKEISSGTVSLVIGTQALFSERVRFNNLELVIVDEQHRFGVIQRLSMVKKGDNPHMLMMTATPIPRTLAITAFGDLEISTIRTLPADRKPIKTHLARKGNESKVYDFVHGELKKGRQAYFVYPLIEESEKIDLRDAESMYKILSEKVFPQYKLALLHSRIPEKEKESLMEQFLNGEIQVLIATSVVEVGVDVPNATVIVVEQAERFGLSALHQLRGRVGRGPYPSYAFLIYDNGLTEEGKLRLKTMHDSHDGFEISNRDLEIRGAGDLAGVKQSGFMKFRIAELGKDQNWMESARIDAMDRVQSDSGFQQQRNHLLKDLFQRVPPFSDELIARG